MNRRVRYLVTALVAVIVTVSLASVAFAAEPQAATPIASKKAAFTLDSTTKFGGFTLKPGRYEFQHRLSGSEHLIFFTDWRGRPVSPGGVRCTLEARQTKVQQTAVTTIDEGGSRRITRIEFAGEKVAHVLQGEPEDVDLEYLFLVPIIVSPDEK